MRRKAFNKLWDDMEEHKNWLNVGMGLFPDIEDAFSEESKEDRYTDYFVPTYNKVIFMTSYPAQTEVNFFAIMR